MILWFPQHVAKATVFEYIHQLNESELVKNPNPKARKKMVTKAYAAQWLDNRKTKKQDTKSHFK